MKKWEILEGSCLDVLPTLPANHFHCAVTSPPYFGLRSYVKKDDPLKAHEIGSEKTPGEFVAKIVAVAEQVKRVLREDGTFWLNIGDSYCNAGTRNNGTGLDGKRRGGMQSSDGTWESAKNAVADRRRTMGDSVKVKDLCLVPQRLVIALQESGWYIRSIVRWFKCLSGGATLYARTQKGDMPCMVKDLVRLDPKTVKLWNGEKWTQVTAWHESPRPENPLEIELQSGERVGCTPEHLWPTQRGNVRADELKIGDMIQTTALPEPFPCPMPDGLPPEEIGWFVGFYMAEGNMNEKMLHFSVHVKEEDAFRRIKAVAERFHGSCKMRRVHGDAAVITVHGKIPLAIIKHYVGGSVSGDKRLTSACWMRSNHFLSALLDGYLAGDGHYDAGNDRWRLSYTSNDAWTSNLRTLCARLGAKLSLRRHMKTCEGKQHPGYLGEVRLASKMLKAMGEVVAIRSSNARKFWDISVEDEPHLFALASGVLTHNCSPMPEPVRDRPTSAVEEIFLLTKSPTYYYDADAERVPHSDASISRVSQNEGRPVHNGERQRDFPGSPQTLDMAQALTPGGRNLWNWWAVDEEGSGSWFIPNEPLKEAHYAAFPSELARRCISLGTSVHGCCPACGAPWRRVAERKAVKRERPNEHVKRTGEAGTGNVCGNTVAGVAVETKGWEPGCGCGREDVEPCRVLDPFSGAATTLLAALRLGRRATGIELNPAYATLGRKRLVGDNPLFNAISS